MYILNSVMSDFLKDLAKVLNDYKVAIEVDENNNLQFVSYEHDFMVTASRFSEGTFEDCNLSTFVGNLIAEELKNEKN